MNTKEENIKIDFDIKSETCFVIQLIKCRLARLYSGVNLAQDAFYLKYYEFQNKNPLAFLERIVLSLCAVSFYNPNLLYKAIFDARKVDNFPILFGFMIKNDRAYPTIQTCIFLFEAFYDTDPQIRIALLQQFRRGTKVYRYIEIDHVENSNDFSFSVISLRKDIIDQNIFGELPDFDRNIAATCIQTEMTWDDLILPFETFESIEEIVNWAIHHDKMFTDFKVSRKIKKGYRALFYGPSGTGKTLTASLIGKRVNCQVYRIDVANVVSKYIGETEKNLERIFEFAENKQWILFFDEAEALFGKRTATKSSNDRYANQQVAYLLQRIEDYPGIVILASNKKGEIDAAFMRRFQLILEFKIPSPHERFELWDKALSEDFKLHKDVNLREIADKFEITGGILVNILRNLSIFSIKNNSRVINQDNITEFVKKEFVKMGKTLNS